MSAVAVALQAASVVAGSMAQMQAARSQAEAMRAEAAALEHNANVDISDAEAVRGRGSYEGALIRLAGAKTIARQAAAYVSSGYTASSGTPLAMIADTASAVEMDKALRMAAYDVEASRLVSRAAGEKARAYGLRAGASAVESAGRRGAMLSALTGFGRAYATGIDLGVFSNPFAAGAGGGPAPASPTSFGGYMEGARGRSLLTGMLPTLDSPFSAGDPADFKSAVGRAMWPGVYADPLLGAYVRNR